MATRQRHRRRLVWIGLSASVKTWCHDEKAHIANPEQPFPHAYVAAAYDLKGDTRRAVAELAQARVDDRYSSIAV